MTTLTTEPEVLKMAKQAGMRLDKHNGGFVDASELKRFAKLVAEKAREEFGLLAVGMLERTVARAVAKEREECAAICDEETNQQSIGGNSWWATTNCAEAIRARGGEAT